DRHVEHGQMVGHEEGVELAALESLNEALEVREIEVGIGVAAGIAPRPGMDAGGTHECAEAQLPLLAQGVAPLMSRPSERCCASAEPGPGETCGEVAQYCAAARRVLR